MKNLTILVFSLLFVNLIFSQEGAIKITNQTSKKEIVIKENKRIKIKTTDGQKISGRFIIENNMILIKNEHLALSDIAEIKRHPILISILSSGLFIYVGMLTAGIGVLIGAIADSSAFLLVIPGALMIYTGIKSPNFSRKYKNDGKWNFEFITVSD